MRRIRRPKIRIEIVTDDNTFTLRFEDTKDYTGDQFGAKLLSFQTKNAMEDDSAVFQINMAGDVYWDKLVMANDIIRIFLTPNADPSDKEGNTERLIQVGMVSQVSKVGSYGNDQTQYRITGQSFIKPFMKFGLGVIQEVQAVLPEVGWLVDGDGENEVKFTGSSAHEVMTGIIDRFIPYLKYNYTEQTYNTIKDYLEYDDLTSWDEYEKLTEVSAFTNFDGTLKQLMDMVTARPFNELFFKNSEKTKGKAQLVLRKTPFNPTEWNALESIIVPTEDFIEEDVGKSDVETYSIFTVLPAGMLKELTGNVFSKPQFHQELVDRYGYSKLETENLYLGAKDTSATEDDDKNEDDKGTERGTYDKLKKDLDNYGKENLSKGKDKYTSKLSSKYKNLKKAEVKKILDSYIKSGKLSKEEYEKITGNKTEDEKESDSRPKLTKEKLQSIMKENFKSDKSFSDKKEKKKATDAVMKEVTTKYKYGNKAHAKKMIDEYIKYKGTPPKDKDGDIYDKYLKAIEGVANVASDTGSDASDDPLVIFSRMLFNWYYNNPNFFAGNITVLGDTKYDLGKRLFIEDKQRDDVWEFYIESVEHRFDYKQGFFTTIGVTRGLKKAKIKMAGKEKQAETSEHRFAGLWNQSSDFMGGLMGEETSKNLKEKGAEEKKSSGGKDGGGDSDEGGDVSGGSSLKKLEKYKGKLPKYDGKTYPGNPQTGGLVGECTWYVYNRRHQFGLSCKGWGDASRYDEGARADGIAVGTKPKRGAIINWEAFASGDHGTGHVAFVESVSKDGKKIHISEYNFAGHHIYGERTLSISSLPKGKFHFIY